MAGGIVLAELLLDLRAQVTYIPMTFSSSPWCYIGKRRFEKGLKSATQAGLDVKVRWRPFFLDPTLPKEGMDKLQRYTQKFGATKVPQMLQMMKQVGEAEDIKFSYGGMISNTLDSHRLMEYAFKTGGHDLQNKLCDAVRNSVGVVIA